MVSIFKSQLSPSNLLDDGSERPAVAADEPLVKRLRFGVDETPDLIPPLLLRKYIGYARKYCTPK